MADPIDPDQFMAQRQQQAQAPMDPDAFMASRQQEAIEQPKGSAASRAAGGFWDTTLGGLGKAAKMLYHFSTPAPGGIPNYEAIRDAHDLVQSHMDQVRKAKEAWDQGNPIEAVGHGVAAAVPVIGPAAAHAGERIGGTQPQFDKYGNVVKPGQAPDIAGGIGEGAGLIVSSSPKNIIDPVASGVGDAVSAAVPHRLTPEGLYQSSLRPSLSKKNLPKIEAEVKTGLNEGIPVGRSGLNKVHSTIEDVNQQIADKVANSTAPDINPLDVTKPVNRLKPTFANQVNPDADLASIQAAKQEFLDKHSTKAPYTEIAPNPYAYGAPEGGMVPTGSGVVKTKQPISVADAQAEKQGTYRQLSKKYSELGSADVEAQKALARGLKDEIAKRVPEIAGLNARDSALIGLQNELERMVAREGNKNVLGLVPATMAHNPFGFLATLAMDNPAIKSRIAIILNRVRKMGGQAPNVAAPVGAASLTGADANDTPVPKFAKGGIIKRPTLLVDAATKKPSGLMAEKGPEAIVPIGPPDPLPVDKAVSQLGEKFRIRFPQKRKA